MNLINLVLPFFLPILGYLIILFLAFIKKFLLLSSVYLIKFNYFVAFDRYVPWFIFNWHSHCHDLCRQFSFDEQWHAYESIFFCRFCCCFLHISRCFNFVLFFSLLFSHPHTRSHTPSRSQITQLLLCKISRRLDYH